jgi:hypothetical protein
MPIDVIQIPGASTEAAVTRTLNGKAPKAEPSNQCEICDKPGPNLCGHCKTTKYCSAACQKADYRTHKLLCKVMQDFPDSARPKPTGPRSLFRRAIYFEPSKDHPQFVWLEVRKTTVGDNGIYFLPNLDSLISDKRTEQAIEYITTNERTKRDLGKAINVRYRGNFYNDGSIKNRGIWRILDPALRGKVQDWKGPMLFLGMEEIDYVPEVPPVDLDASDLRHVVDWLHSKTDRQR